MGGSRRHHAILPAARAMTGRLHRLIDACSTSGVPRRALHVALWSMLQGSSGPALRARAAAALDPLAGADRAQRFSLPKGDLVVVWRGPGRAALRASLEALAALLAGMRLRPTAMLCRLFHLPRDAASLREVLAARPTGPQPARRALLPLDAESVALLEAALAQADVAHFLRRRDVYGTDRKGALRRRWDRRSLDLDEVMSSLAPGISAEGAPWLAARLRRVLDRRKLALLCSPQELTTAGPLGIDLAVDSLMSAEFLRFDSVLPARLRGRVAIALHAADILADWPAFAFAQAFARSREYRLALHNADADLLPLLPREAFGLDLIELRWTADLPDRAQALGEADPARLVLIDAATPGAIAWGRSQGIQFFEQPPRVGQRGDAVRRA
jgi:hypothetical protein